MTESVDIDQTCTTVTTCKFLHLLNFWKSRVAMCNWLLLNDCVHDIWRTEEYILTKIVAQILYTKLYIWIYFFSGRGSKNRVTRWHSLKGGGGYRTIHTGRTCCTHVIRFTAKHWLLHNVLYYLWQHFRLGPWMRIQFCCWFYQYFHWFTLYNLVHFSLKWRYTYMRHRLRKGRKRQNDVSRYGRLKFPRAG